MKTILSTSLLSLVFFSAACTAANDDDVGTGEDAVIADAAIRPLEAAFRLEQGAGDENAVIAGDCYRALRGQNIPDRQYYAARQYKNGAIVVEVSTMKPICVDLHGANKLSFSGAMLDGIDRYGLGKLNGVRRGAPESVTVEFEKGSMLVTTHERAEERYATVRTTPKLYPVLRSAPVIAGDLDAIVINDVQILGDQPEHRGQIRIEGEVLHAIRLAPSYMSGRFVGSVDHAESEEDWPHGTFPMTLAKRRDRFSFQGEVSVTHDYAESMAARGPVVNETVSIGFGGTEPTITCQRTYYRGLLERPGEIQAYSCTGL